LKQSAAVLLLYCGSGLDEQSQTLVLNIYLYQKARQRFRRMNFKFPTIGNTCSLCVMRGRPSDFKLIARNQPKRTYLTRQGITGTKINFKFAKSPDIK